MNIKDKFTIKNLSKKKRKPYYIIRYSMDANDGDYIKGESEWNKDEWDNAPDFFFLMLAYLAKGYSGKFSHGESWGDYYGHHWARNKHGLYDEICAFQEYYGIVCSSEWDTCHSYSDFEIEYYDEENRKHEVTIPSIDDLFKSEEEMLNAIRDAYQKVSEEG